MIGRLVFPLDQLNVRYMLLSIHKLCELVADCVTSVLLRFLHKITSQVFWFVLACKAVHRTQEHVKGWAVLSPASEEVSIQSLKVTIYR